MPTLTLLSTRQRGAPDLRIPVVIYHARHCLHMTGVEKLVRVVDRLVDAGNAVVVLEHRDRSHTTRVLAEFLAGRGV